MILYGPSWQTVVIVLGTVWAAVVFAALLTIQSIYTYERKHDAG